MSCVGCFDYDEFKMKLRLLCGFLIYVFVFPKLETITFMSLLTSTFASIYAYFPAQWNLEEKVNSVLKSFNIILKYVNLAKTDKF